MDFRRIDRFAVSPRFESKYEDKNDRDTPSLDASDYLPSPTPLPQPSLKGRMRDPREMIAIPDADLRGWLAARRTFFRAHGEPPKNMRVIVEGHEVWVHAEFFKLISGPLKALYAVQAKDKPGELVLEGVSHEAFVDLCDLIHQGGLSPARNADHFHRLLKLAELCEQLQMPTLLDLCDEALLASLKPSRIWERMRLLCRRKPYNDLCKDDDKLLLHRLPLPKTQAYFAQANGTIVDEENVLSRAIAPRISSELDPLIKAETDDRAHFKELADEALRGTSSDYHQLAPHQLFRFFLYTTQRSDCAPLLPTLFRLLRESLYEGQLSQGDSAWLIRLANACPALQPLRFEDQISLRAGNRGRLSLSRLHMTARCGYFRIMLSGNFKEKARHLLRVCGIEPKLLRLIDEWARTGTIRDLTTLDLKTNAALFETARFLDASDFEAEIESQLIQQLNSSNIAYCLRLITHLQTTLSYPIEMPRLFKNCIHTINRHASGVLISTQEDQSFKLTIDHPEKVEPGYWEALSCLRNVRVATIGPETRSAPVGQSLLILPSLGAISVYGIATLNKFVASVLETRQLPTWGLYATRILLSLALIYLIKKQPSLLREALAIISSLPNKVLAIISSLPNNLWVGTRDWVPDLTPSLKRKIAPISRNVNAELEALATAFDTDVGPPKSHLHTLPGDLVACDLSTWIDLTGHDLSSLADQCPNIQTLTIGPFYRFNREDWAHLTRFRHLKQLIVDLNKEGFGTLDLLDLQRLTRAGLRLNRIELRLRQLYSSPRHFLGIAEPAFLRNLPPNIETHVNVSGHMGFRGLVRLAAQCTHMTRLDLFQNSLTNSAITALGEHCPRLRALHQHDWSRHRHFEPAPGRRLPHLHFGVDPLTAENIAAFLSTNAHLQSLTLTNQPSSTIQQMVSGSPRLEQLTLKYVPSGLSPQALQTVANLKELKRVVLCQCFDGPIPASVDNLRTRIPPLETLSVYNWEANSDLLHKIVQYNHKQHANQIKRISEIRLRTIQEAVEILGVDLIPMLPLVLKNEIAQFRENFDTVGLRQLLPVWQSLELLDGLLNRNHISTWRAFIRLYPSQSTSSFQKLSGTLAELGMTFAEEARAIMKEPSGYLTSASSLQDISLLQIASPLIRQLYSLSPVREAYAQIRNAYHILLKSRIYPNLTDEEATNLVQWFQERLEHRLTPLLKKRCRQLFDLVNHCHMVDKAESFCHEIGLQELWTQFKSRVENRAQEKGWTQEEIKACLFGALLPPLSFLDPLLLPEEMLSASKP